MIRKVGEFWKQEFQRHGALHFHLLLYGIAHEDDARAVQRWIAEPKGHLIGYPAQRVSVDKSSRDAKSRPRIYSSPAFSILSEDPPSCEIPEKTQFTAMQSDWSFYITTNYTITVIPQT